ncbi:AAA family ATPase [Paenarthrobacter sp. AMU7]|uniref:AAA family ATPase n=1 Tax=Paenarthrobacter sp. AMU7 TaxID=3162492 RepID=A0AB39YQ53_9MICC
MTQAPDPLSEVTLAFNDVFPGTTSDTFFETKGWEYPVSYFVGRNGSGKSRTAKLVAEHLGGSYLSTDRLSGLMSFSNWGWTSVPAMDSYKGVPLGDTERSQAAGLSAQGSGVGALYALKDQPEVWLRVAAFLRRALGRVIELRESAGYLDPYIRVGGSEYSLLRDEGHGLRELVILLTAAYREDWTLLVVDEPELHLHPAMARLWLSELENECRRRNSRAVVVTHEPTMLKPATAGDLGAVWYFSADRPSQRLIDHVGTELQGRVTSSLKTNPQLISQLVFSPRPVLVEGVHDVAALTTSLERTQPPEVVAQTDLVECGGSGAVALWFAISHSLGLDVRAVADLDACLASEVQAVMDRSPDVVSKYRSVLLAEPPRSHVILRPLIEEMNNQSVPASPKQRAAWLAASVAPGTGHEARLTQFQDIWRDAGFWLHPQGTLEDVLSITAKGREVAQEAASRPGPIDDVARWCAFELDAMGDVEILLGAAVERIAHAIMEALRVEPLTQFTSPVGGSSISDSRLVDVTPLGDGRHRITVKKPEAFSGQWVDFSRDTPSNFLQLNKADGGD